MNTKSIFALVLLLLAATGKSYSGTGVAAPLYQAIIVFPVTPNPCENKCLIRTYFPERDTLSKIQILNPDSTVAKEISMAKEVGVGSAAINVSDLKDGKYTYQLIYKGETRPAMPLVIKH